MGKRCHESITATVSECDVFLCLTGDLAVGVLFFCPFACVFLLSCVFVQSKEVRKILRTAVHVPSELYALLPPVGGIIDHLGVAAAKVTLAYGLEVRKAEHGTR